MTNRHGGESRQFADRDVHCVRKAGLSSVRKVKKLITQLSLARSAKDSRALDRRGGGRVSEDKCLCSTWTLNVHDCELIFNPLQ